MLDQRVKIAAAASVLLVGVVAALLFRRDPVPISPPVPGTTDHLVLGKQLDQQPAANPDALLRPGQCGPMQSAPAGCQPAGRPITIVAPLDSGQLPPDLARSYPDNSLPGGSHWGIFHGADAARDAGSTGHGSKAQDRRW